MTLVTNEFLRLRAKHKVLIMKVTNWASEVQHGKAHVDRWTRVLAAFVEKDYPNRMTAEEADTYASRFMASRWRPVYEAIVEFEAARTARVTAQSDHTAEQELQAEEDLEKKPPTQSGSTASPSSIGTKPISVSGEIKKALFSSSIGTKSASDTRENNIDTIKEQAKLIVNLREHLADRDNEIAQLKSAGYATRKGSPEWRHENIISQIDGLPTWTRAEAKKYYNSIGKRYYDLPTPTRKGLFWMDFTTDDNGNEVQTEKPIARWNPLLEIYELEKTNQNKEMEIQTLLNTMTSNADIMKVNELEGKIAHLKIKLKEATESYVDINNIPFATAVQVLAKGEFPEPHSHDLIRMDSADVSELMIYKDKIYRILSQLNTVLPIYGDKKHPSNIVKRHKGTIDDYGQLKSQDYLYHSLLEFCRSMDMSYDHTIQNLQGIENAIKKTIKGAVR